MKLEEVGAFEAKTHFSELLRGVEKGNAYTITRNGRPIAKLAPIEENADRDAATTLRLIRETRARYQVSVRDIVDWRREGQR